MDVRPAWRRVGAQSSFQLAEITTYQALAAWSSRKQESDTAKERYSSENWEQQIGLMLFGGVNQEQYW